MPREKDLHKVPSVSFDRIDCTRLLKDLAKLRNEVSLLQENVVTKDMLDEFKIDFRQASIASPSSSSGVKHHSTSAKNAPASAQSISFHREQSNEMYTNTTRHVEARTAVPITRAVLVKVATTKAG